MVEDLSKRRISRKTEVHLDPDLRSNSIDRSTFQSAFGQCGHSQFHLRKEGIHEQTAASDADLFLFFGLYQKVSLESDTWKYKKNPAVHLIFGWLQVRSICRLPEDAVPEGLSSHPHALPSYIVSNELARFKKTSNTIYLSRERLTFKAELEGAGLFGKLDPAAADDPRRLTKAGQRKASLWRVPSFFRNLSNMGKKQPECIGDWWEPQRIGPGQEFVLKTKGREPEVSNWLEMLFKNAGKMSATRSGH